MNKEEYAIEEKIYKSQEGLEIKIIHSNLERRYKKIGNQLYLMPDKESAKLEDSLTTMVRLNKENEEINRKKEIEKIREQAKKEIKQIEEVKDTRIQELQKELERLKQLYEEKLKIKEEY